VWAMASKKLRELGPSTPSWPGPTGRGVSEGSRHDMDGWWLTELTVGIVGRAVDRATIDRIADLTQPWSMPATPSPPTAKNPHIDQRQRGLEAVGILF